jgi:lysosomal alpha-glucosidase
MCFPASPAQRVDCFQDGEATEQLCKARGCCFDPSAGDAPGSAAKCFYPLPANALRLVNLTRDIHGDHGVVDCGGTHRAGDGIDGRGIGYFGSEVCPLSLEVAMESPERVRVRITDPAEDRWEVPPALFPPVPPSERSTREPASRVYKLNYSKEPFGLAVTRRATGELLFNATPAAGRGSGLTFEEQLVTLTALVPETFWLYGVGEQNAPHRLPRGGLNADGSELVDVYTLLAKDQQVPRHDPAGGTGLYGSHPLLIAVSSESGTAFGIFLRSSAAMDVLLSRDSVAFRAVGGVVDFSVLMGPSIREIITQYTDIVGRPALPPYWGLGFHLCRWGYGGVDKASAVVEAMRVAGVGQDAQWLDIDYMQQAHDFSVDPLAYPLGMMRAFVAKLHAQGQRFVPIVDPGIAAFPAGAYPPLDEGLAAGVFVLDAGTGAPVKGRVWPGDTLFPDFLHPAAGDWWTAQLRRFQALLSFDGLWLDMNEPSNFCDGPCDKPTRPETSCGDFAEADKTCRGGTTEAEVARKGRLFAPWKLRMMGGRKREPAMLPYIPGGRPLEEKTLAMDSVHCVADRWRAQRTAAGCTKAAHLDVHNLYGLSETAVTHEALQSLLPTVRPLIISRSTFPGAGRFAGHWLGDNCATWEDLRASLPGVLTMGLFGLSLVGADICGFAGATTRELCIRWTQVGALAYPFARNHNDNVSPAQEPSAWDAEATAMMRAAIATRYRLLPYLYSAFHDAHATGIPVARSLLLEFQEEALHAVGGGREMLDAIAAVDEQVMMGGALLVTPVLAEGARNVTGYFPPGRWFALASGEELRPVPWGSSAPGAERGSVPGRVQLEAPLDTVPVHVRGGYVVPMQRAALTSQAARATPFTFLAAPNGAGGAAGRAVLDDGETSDRDAPRTILRLALHSSLGGESGNFTLSPEGSYSPNSDPRIMQDMTVEEVRVLGVWGLSGRSLQGMANGEPLSPEAFLFDEESKALSIRLWKQPLGVPRWREAPEDREKRRAEALRRGEPRLPSATAPLEISWSAEAEAAS